MTVHATNTSGGWTHLKLFATLTSLWIVKKITHIKVVCEVLTHKADLHSTLITISGNRICYPGDVVIPTGSLDMIKLIINNVLSRRNAWFITFDIKKI